MMPRRDPDGERERRAARIVGLWVGVSSGVVVVGGVLILLGVVLSSSRREGEQHDGGWFAGRGVDDFVIDIDVVIPVVVLLGLVGIGLLSVIASIAAGRAARPLGDALRRQRAFVADASHELRTPLTALTSRIQVLQRRVERGEDAADTIRDLRRDAERMRDVLSDMLIAAEGESFVGESAELGAAVQEAIGAMQPLAAERGVRIHGSDIADATVQIPSVTLVRALVALLDNAISHSMTGGAVTLSARHTGTHVEIRVADQGPGISGIDPADVFERFARTSAHASGRGFGLGLSLVRDVARRAGGSVVVESTSPEGSVFLFTLPTTARRK